MHINVGHFDRSLRIILGAAIISLVYWGPESPWGYLGFIPLLSGVVGFCPLYRWLGMETSPKHQLRQF